MKWEEGEWKERDREETKAKQGRGHLKGWGGSWRTVAGHGACEPGIFTSRKRHEAQSGVRTEKERPKKKQQSIHQRRNESITSVEPWQSKCLPEIPAWGFLMYSKICSDLCAHICLPTYGHINLCLRICTSAHKDMHKCPCSQHISPVHSSSFSCRTPSPLSTQSFAPASRDFWLV